MPERPLVLFGKPDDAARYKITGYPPPPHLPSYSRQKERLTPQLQELQSVLDRGTLTLQETPDGIEPEYTLVFEACGDLDGFHTAIKNLQKTYPIELLFETDIEDVLPDEDFYYLKQGLRDDKQTLTFKCFCVLANLRALQEIMTLWKNYEKNENFSFPIGKKKLKDVFNALKSIHLWGIEERFIETGTMQSWEEDLADSEIQNVKCEIELSYRSSSTKRILSERKIESEINRVGGKILAKSCIIDIGYHAILAEIPRQIAQNMISKAEVSFLSFNEILFVNPSGQTAVSASVETIMFEGKLTFPDKINDEPILALFDGLPQERHPLLEKFLTIDDPDDITSFYQIIDRQHGTAMASQIIWGELFNNSSSISRKIYVRPIMKPYKTINNNSNEYVPDDILLVDKIHIAVKRLFEPEDTQPIHTIKIINLSIGITTRPFYTMISPLAKLLDWLSFKYKILFIVSAGNYADDIDLDLPYSDFLKMNIKEKDKTIIQSINRQARNRKLLSPAESINSLTVGALFSDNSNYLQEGHTILPCSDNIPAPYSALGRGVNHSIKPDLLIEGGRNVVNEDYKRNNIAHWGINSRTRPPGIMHAKPFNATVGNGVGYSCGTSNSAAILSYNAIKCFDVLEDVFLTETGHTIPADFSSLLLKAMLVHGAKWDNMAPFIGQALGLFTRGEYSNKIHKFIGYGVPDINRVKECTKNRITIIGFGELFKEKAHLYSIPLPFDFSSKRILRNLTVTMTYFTPIKPNTKKYKQAQVWFTLEDEKDLVKNRSDASDKAVTRGTIQHERFFSEDLVSWTSEDLLKIKVNCRENINRLDHQIPYSIFITFEIAPEYDIDVYAVVLENIRLRGEITVPIRG